jgi:hypothetical protein
VSGTGGGNQVSNNFIHDIPAQNINANIRCDDDQHDTTIEHNVVTRVCGEGVIFKGKNTIRNNIFYDIRDRAPDGTPCIHRRGYLVLPYGAVDGSIVQRNIFVSRIAGQALLYERTRPATPSAGQRTPAMLRTCAADYNVYFNTADPTWGQRHFEAQRRFGIEQRSVEADPQFVDPQNDDFGLHEHSPARKLGFEAIDISHVGPRGP